MRKIALFVVPAVVILLGFAGWAIPGSRPLQAEASAAIEAQIDPFSIMASAKDLPRYEFQDSFLALSPPIAEGRSSPTP
jgi:hypothetical protein